MWIQYIDRHRHRPPGDRRISVHRSPGQVVNAPRAEAADALKAGAAVKIPSPATRALAAALLAGTAAPEPTES